MRRLRPIVVIPGWTLVLLLGTLLGAGLFLIDAGSLPLASPPRQTPFRALLIKRAARANPSMELEQAP